MRSAGAKRLSMVPPPKELFLEAVTKVGCACDGPRAAAPHACTAACRAASGFVGGTMNCC